MTELTAVSVIDNEEKKLKSKKLIKDATFFSVSRLLDLVFRHLIFVSLV